MSVGTGYDEQQGDAMLVDEKISLCPIFFPDQLGLGQPTPAQVVL
jgi:hypothetical protein